MKKSIIASGAAAVALAAMPAFGAFADVTDTVQINIRGACSVGQTSSSQTGGGVTLTATMTNGSTKSWDADGSAGGTLKVSCNDASGWNIKAVGNSEGTAKTSMKPTDSGTPIPTGTSGDPSFWAFKVAGTGAESAFTSWHAVPAEATKVAGGGTAVSERQINTGYQVHVSASQEADTYTGKVLYTVSAGENS